MALDGSGRRLTPSTPLKFRSVNATTATGAGSNSTFAGAVSSLGIQVLTANGTTATNIVELQGSIAGGSSDFTTLDTWASSSDSDRSVRFVTGKPVNYARVNVVSANSSDTVTAWISGSF